MKYLYLAKKRGCRVVVVNPYLEPGLDRYWVPSNVESALFGTQICDLHVPVRPGGDVALANAVLKRLIARGAVDQAFVAGPHRAGGTTWSPRSTRQDDRRPARPGRRAAPSRSTPSSTCTRRRRRAVLVWSMGITQHRDAVDGVRAIVNLGLARGNVGRDGAGLMPIRGPLGRAGRRRDGRLRHRASPAGVPVDAAARRGAVGAVGLRRCPDRPGAPRPRWSRPPAAGEIDVLWTSGGNFLEVLPDPPAVERPSDRVPLRVHQDVVLSSQMLVEGDDVHPPPRRHPLRAGGRRHRDHHRAPHRLQPGDPPPGRRGAQRVAALRRRGISGAARPGRARSAGPTTPPCGRRSPRSSPPTPASRTLAATGDQVQWGGRHLCAGGEFPLAGRPGSLHRRSRPPRPELPDGLLHAWPRAGASSSTRWCTPMSTRSPGPGATRSTSTRPTPRALGASDGRPRPADAAPPASFDGPPQGGAPPRPVASRSTGPEGNVLIASGDGPPRAGLQGPRLQRGGHRRGAGRLSPPVPSGHA